MIIFLLEIALLVVTVWAAWRLLRYGFSMGPSAFPQTAATNALFALFAVADVFLEMWPAAPIAFAGGLLLIALRAPNPRAGVEKGASRVGRATRDWLVLYAVAWGIASQTYKFDVSANLVGYGLAAICSAAVLYSAARRPAREPSPAA